MASAVEYCLVSSIPSSFHSSDLRNFFAVFIASEKFDVFHFRHRPQTMVVDAGEDTAEGGTASTSLKRFCCPVRFSREEDASEFVKKYHGKHWMDKEGNELPSRAIISKITIGSEDLVKFATKEFRPPKLMPRGNIGTPNSYFLNLIRECRLPPSLITKLGLEFPRGRVHKKYSNVPYDYGTSKSKRWDYEEEEEVVTGRGHTLSSVYIPGRSNPKIATENSSQDSQSDKESNADDDDDRCEEWERHEALHDHRTTHGGIVDEDKERLFEEKIELKWEKGGSGLVFYTDAQFWNDQKGDFDERTADDWDVNMEGYYVPGGGDKDARDYMEMRRSERFQKGLEDISVFAPKQTINRPRPSSPEPTCSNKDPNNKIGAFEKYTRGIGRQIMEKHGWKDGKGLGTTIVGITDALGNDGQGPSDRRGFGYYGEKLEFSSEYKKSRKRPFHEYSVEAEDRIIIGTIYDKPEDLDVSEPLKRRNAPTFIKRYEFVRGTDKTT